MNLDTQKVLTAMRALLETLTEVGAEEWSQWLLDALERASGQRSPGIDWAELLWFVRLNYVPVLRFVQERERNAPSLSQSEAIISEQFEIFLKALDPNWPVEVCGFVRLGAKSDLTMVMGPLGGVDDVVKASIPVVNLYWDAIIDQRLTDSYSMTADTLRSAASFKAYVGSHHRAAAKYGGPPVSWAIQQVSSVYTGPALPKWERKWPKAVTAASRRSIVEVFYTTNRASETGICCSIWLTEEGSTYRVAKYQFYET